MPQPKYRADIDGLRAIAVLSVVGFHAFPDVVRGGFVGVDVFFVISGFLISTIIFSGLEQGTFSFAEFYARRIRRIFPALALVLAASLALGWFVLLPDEYRLLGKHAAAGAAFASNFVLWPEAGYFDANADTKPLLHLWSLAIEEQFYVVWPLLLGLAWGRSGRFLGLTAAVAVLSFAINIHLSGRSPAAAFYLPVTRFWELMVGGLLAYAVLHRPAHLEGNVHLRAASGLALVVLAVAVIDRERALPGWWALLPTVGAFLLISGGRDAWVNRWLLSSRPLTWLGRISYPLYLWHWALLVIAGIALQGALGDGMKILVIGASVLLAGATYEFLERPIREGKKSVTPLVLAMVLLFAAGAGLHLQDGLPQRLKPEQRAVLDHFDQSLPEWRYYERNRIAAAYRDDCNFYDIAAYREGHPTRVPIAAISESCHEAIPGKKIAFIWGDSHAQQFRHGLSHALPSDWQVLQVASSGCAPRSRNGAASSSDYCEHSNRFALERIRAARPDVVVLGQESGHEIEALRGLAADLKQAGAARVVVMGPVPRWKTPLYKRVARNDPPGAPRRMLDGLDGGVMARNRAVAAGIGGAEPFEYVDVIGFFCDDRGCLTYLGNDVIAGLTSFDYGHLTPDASRLIGEKLLGPLLTGT